MANDSFRRIVTMHDDRGLSIVRSDDRLVTTPIDSGDAAFRLVWATPTVPADLNTETDGPHATGKTLTGGSVIRVVDMLPGKSSPMHRSYSIDYGIVLSGRLEMELDGGAVVALNAGDIVVQRATSHLWRNPSADTPCRIVFVLTESLPVEVNGRILPEIHP